MGERSFPQSKGKHEWVFPRKVLETLPICLLSLADAVPVRLRTSHPACDRDKHNPPFAWTAVALTQTALSTPVVTFIPTLEVTPIPTLPPPPILTPDEMQVKRWQEYQTELAKGVLSGYLWLDPDIYRYALCEWDILGRSDQELYVWAYCSVADGRGGDLPAVIHLEADGSVQNVEVPSRGSK